MTIKTGLTSRAELPLSFKACTAVECITFSTFISFTCVMMSLTLKWKQKIEWKVPLHCMHVFSWDILSKQCTLSFFFFHGHNVQLVTQTLKQTQDEKKVQEYPDFSQFSMLHFFFYHVIREELYRNQGRLIHWTKSQTLSNSQDFL